MKALTLHLLTIFFCVLPAVSQIPDVAWEKHFVIDNSHYFSDVVELKDGSYLIAGAIERPDSFDSDIWLLMFNSNGDTLKSKIFSNPGNDIPMRIVCYNEDGYLLSYINLTEEKAYSSRLMALDTGFGVRWNKTAEKISAINRTDVAADDDGNIWWLNTYAETNGKSEITINKLDKDGNILNDFGISDKHPVEGYAIKVLPDKTIGVSCRFLAAGELASVQAIRMGNDGKIIWKSSVTSPGRNLTPQCLCCSPDNTMLVGGWAGLCYNPDAPAEEQIWDYDFLLSKIDDKGKVIWTQNYNREGSEKGTAIAVTPNGTILAAGKCETSFTGSIGPWLLLVDVNGKMIGEKVFKLRLLNDQVARIIYTSDGGMLMVGPGYINTENRLSGWVKKLNPMLRAEG